jgi:hypothetical protein
VSDGVLGLLFKQNGMGDYVAEHKFHPKRQFRFDYAWPGRKVAVEYEGGLYQHGWHGSITRYASDCVKYNLAALDGWKVLRYTAADDWQTIVEQVKEALGE